MTPDIKHYPARIETQPDGSTLYIAACGYIGYSPAVFVKDAGSVNSMASFLDRLKEE